MTFSVTALRLGSIEIDRSGVLWGLPPGDRMTIPVWGAAIEGNGYRIVVDTGFADPAGWSRYNPCRQDPTETMPAALAELGWRTGDVDVVINTHLHYDHSENNPLFTRARFYVSQAEWNHARAPVPSQRWSYACEWTGPQVDYLDYTLVAADHHDVLPGLRLIQTPGHTPGHQSVLVDTADGVLCVAGDAACVVENLAGPVATGVTIDADLSLASISKIALLSDCILMNHDPGLAAYQRDNFPRVRRAPDSIL
ncbi:N-acyl homoserine lactonase family protein [uncultured Jatrophihabitans sp.]|uniref:N-acyl homoserine lactonase family protein n=1 Tax=uncultured Jatrophihabitans sp. TaxID=1610747 RepID=UPI0035CA55BA